MAGPLGVGSPWSAFVGSGGSAGLLRFISSALACRCSSGARLGVLLSGVRLSRGGSLSCGGGCVSLAGCGRRSFRASAPRRPTPPQNRKPTPPAKRRELLLSCRFRLRPLSRGKPPQNSRPLAGPQGEQRLTRRLFTALYSAPLPVGPAPVRNPHRAAEAKESGGTVPGARREASLTLRSVLLRENRRDRRRTPASASPVLATETLSSSLASAAAWSCAGPQCQPHLWPGVRSAWPKGSPCHP